MGSHRQASMRQTEKYPYEDPKGDTRTVSSKQRTYGTKLGRTTSIYEAQFAIFIDFPTVVNAKAVTVQTPSFMRLSTVFTENPNS